MNSRTKKKQNKVIILFYLVKIVKNKHHNKRSKNSYHKFFAVQQHIYCSALVFSDNLA